MNAWLIAALAILATLIPAMIVCLRGDPIDRLIGLELASSLAVLALLLLAEGIHRLSFFDLPLALALLAFAGALVFARFFERWL